MTPWKRMQSTNKEEPQCSFFAEYLPVPLKKRFFAKRKGKYGPRQDKGISAFINEQKRIKPQQ